MPVPTTRPGFKYHLKVHAFRMSTVILAWFLIVAAFYESPEILTGAQRLIQHGIETVGGEFMRRRASAKKASSRSNTNLPGRSGCPGSQGGLNLYAYVGNDPLNAADLLGLDNQYSVGVGSTLGIACRTLEATKHGDEVGKLIVCGNSKSPGVVRGDCSKNGSFTNDVRFVF